MRKFFGVCSSVVCLGVALSLSTAPALAQNNASMPGMSMSPSSGTAAMPDMHEDGGASTQAFKGADQKMMKDMDAPYTGDADRDFVAHMIPHHQGAIDMAKVELEYGKDPELKRLAGNIVKAQREEIAFMRRWQAKHPAP
jgi:uncharacterized protein (DUF305 family)